MLFRLFQNALNTNYQPKIEQYCFAQLSSFENSQDVRNEVERVSFRWPEPVPLSWNFALKTICSSLAKLYRFIALKFTEAGMWKWG